MIQIKNLSKFYNNRIIFEKLNLQIKTWEKVMLVWESGSWKTTLLKIISGIDNKYSWKVEIDWEDIWKFSEKQLCDFRKEKIWFVFQFFNLYDKLDVENNIKFISKICKVDFPVKKRCEKLIKELNLEKIKKKKLDTLSWWELQRVAIARALFNKPSILLLDEANSHLDKKNVDNFYKILDIAHKKYNLTIISVNHNNENKSFFNKIIKLN